MKHMLILFLIIFPAYFANSAVDPENVIYLKVDKTLLEKVDKIYFIDTCLHFNNRTISDGKREIKLSDLDDNILDIYHSIFWECGGLKLILKDSSEYVIENIPHKYYITKITLSWDNGKIKEDYYFSNTPFAFFLLLIIIGLIIIPIFKFSTFMIILRPRGKFILFCQWLSLEFLFFFIYIILQAIIGLKNLELLTLLKYIFVLVVPISIDILFFKINTIGSIKKIILSIIIGNVVAYSIILTLYLILP
jgi:hypothetical protein